MSDYQTTLTEVFGIDALAYVVLTDPARSVPDARGLVGIKVTTAALTGSSPAPADTVGITIDLLETGIGTGVFRGAFGFTSGDKVAPSVDPLFGRVGIGQTGLIKVANGQQVNLATESNPSGTSSRTHNFRWFAAQTATITVTDAFGGALDTDSQLLGYGAQLNVQVNDFDLNRQANSAESYNRLLRAFSDSDPVGEWITITETGQNTGIFQGNVRFESSLVAGNGRVFARDGDRVQLEYVEPRTTEGEPRVLRLPASGDWTFRERADGAILADRATYFGETSAGNRNGADRAIIVITDPGERSRGGARAGEITVRVTTGTTPCDPQNAAQFALPATQLGSQSVTFVAALGFTTGADQPTADPPLKSVGNVNRATVNVCYQDVDKDNVARTRTHSFTWRAVQTANVALAGGDTLLSGTGRDFVITVTDADSNRNPSGVETMTVRVKTTSDPTTGLTVTLSETGPDTGLFTGTFRFTTGETGGGAVKVATGDRVVVEYNDPFTLPLGEQRVVRSGYATWRAPTDATLTTDRTTYLPDRATGETRYRNPAVIYLQDLDRSNPLERSQLPVQVISATNGVPSTTLTLTETGTNTGLFVGFLAFDTAGSSSGTLGAGSGSDPDRTQFRIRYEEPLADGTQRFVETALLTVWRNPSASVAQIGIQRETTAGGFEWGQPQDRHHMPTGQETLLVVVNAKGSDIFGTTKQVRITTSICTHERVFDLTQAGGSEGHRWTAPVVFNRISQASECTTPNNPPNNVTPCLNVAIVCVNVGGTFTIRVTLADGTTVLTYTSPVLDRPAETLTFTQPGSTTTLTQSSGLNAPVGIRLTGWNHDSNTQVRQFVEVTVFSRERNQAVPVLLTETDVSSGVFTGTIQFTEGSTTGRVPVASGLGLVVTKNTPGYGLFDHVVVEAPPRTESGQTLVSRNVFTWFPANDATVSVREEGFGTGAFRVDLFDGDGLPHRVFQTGTTATGQTAYNYNQGAGIAGSELIYVHRQQTTNCPSGIVCVNNNNEFTLNLAVTNLAAERIADRNRNGVVDCSDITLTGHQVNAIGETEVRTRCISVDPAEGKIVFRFQNPDIQSGVTCSPNPPVVVCRIRVDFSYRAAAVAACIPTNQEAWVYVRTTTGVQFCAAPQEQRTLEMDYTKAQRTVSVVGPTETESMSLAWVTEPTPRFSGTIQAELTQGASNGRIHVGPGRTSVRFLFADPVMQLDGQAGSATNNHFRSIAASGFWRPAQDATIQAMRHDFTAGAGSTVFGPGVAVEVHDIDASRHDRQDTITIVARSGGSQPVDVVLRETGRDTGIFRGVVPIQQDGFTDGLVVVGTPPSMSLEYSDLHGAAGAGTLRSTVIAWRASETASVDIEGGVNGVFRGTAASFHVEIKDSDRNANPNQVETIQARIVSTSDPIGEVITLSETGLGTGIFRANGLLFETVNTPGNGRVYVRDGDAFWVTYVDPLDALGQQRITDSAAAQWRAVGDGVVRFDRNFHIATATGTMNTAPVGLQKLARAAVTVHDTDRSTNPRIIDTITLSAVGANAACPIDESCLRIGPVDSGTGNMVNTKALTQLRLVETGHNTGEFIGVFSFVCEGSCPGESVTGNAKIDEDLGAGTFGRVPVQAGQFVRVEYLDPDTTVPEQRTFNSEAQWFPAGFGVVRFDRAGYGEYTARPRITVYDSQIPATTTNQPVQVVSEANPSGISLNLQRRSVFGVAETGIYTGQLTLSATGSSSALRVGEEDTIEARYSDADPAGTRTATAVFILGLNDPPVTTLTTNVQPTGQNGWFLESPSVSFTTNRNPSHIETTFFRLGGGAAQEFVSAITLGEGVHEFQFWSVDVIGNVEAPRTGTVRVSLTDPTVEVTGLTATSRPGGRVELSWSPVADKHDPLVFGEYRIMRGDALIGNASSETFTDLPAADGTYTYSVRAANAAGRLSTAAAATIQGLSDRVAPEIEAFVVTPTRLEESLGQKQASASLTVAQASLSDTHEVVLRVFDPFGERVEELAMLRDGETRTWALQYSGFSICGDYALAGIARDQVGNEGSRNVTVRYVAIDKDAPRIVNLPTELGQGRDLSVTVRDNCRGIARVAYTITGQSRVDVPVSGNPLETTFTISADRLQLGPNTITFELADANETRNEALVTRVVTVVTGDPTQPPTALPQVGSPSRLVEHGGQFRFSVTSPTPLTAITMQVGATGSVRNVLAAWEATTGRVGATVGDLEPGPHTVIVRATNAAGTTTETFGFFVLDEGVPLPPTSVTVTKDSRGRPVIEWTPSASDPSKVGGYIVHRQVNPWSVIAVTDASKTSHTDTTAKSGQTYAYAVTAYGVNGEGLMRVGDDSESLAWFGNVDRQSFETEQVGGINMLFVWIALILLAVIVAVGVVAANRQRLFGQKETYDGEYPDEAATPFGVERHHLRCPNCAHDFHVAGERPIVTECPNCGRKGILR